MLSVDERGRATGTGQRNNHEHTVARFVESIRQRAAGKKENMHINACTLLK